MKLLKNYDVQQPPSYNIPFDGETFNKPEYLSWIKTSSSYSKAILWHPKLNTLRSKILYLARENNDVVETAIIKHKEWKEVLEITFTGKLYVNKD